MQPIGIPYHYKVQYGFGDILKEWLRYDNWTSVLKDAAAANQYKITLLVCSHNDQSSEFFKYVPYLKTHFFQWKGETPDYKAASKKLGLCYIDKNKREVFEKKFKKELNEIYLSKEEERKYKIYTEKEYVLIHPFAGDEKRIVHPPEEYKLLIDKLIDEYKQNVIVLGGSFNRGRRLRNIKPCHKKEVLNYRRPGLINLVNKVSLRTAAKIAINTKCFIGNWSAYLCAAWERKIPAIAFLRPEHAKTIKTKPSFEKRWHSECYDITNPDFEKAFTQALITFEKRILTC